MINLEDLTVYYYGEYGETESSKVYYVDPNRDRFLVVDTNGHFEWVNTCDCRLKFERGEEDD